MIRNGVEVKAVLVAFYVHRKVGTDPDLTFSVGAEIAQEVKTHDFGLAGGGDCHVTQVAAGVEDASFCCGIGGAGLHSQITRVVELG